MLGLMCLAQGYNAVTLVRLEPAASWSRVKHSTIALLCSIVLSRKGPVMAQVSLHTRMTKLRINGPAH